jgi:hypothetical protein
MEFRSFIEIGEDGIRIHILRIIIMPQPKDFALPSPFSSI